MGMFEGLLIYGLMPIVGLLALDWALPTVLKTLRHVLPSDVCGSDGWLVDLENGRGVFDRRSRSFFPRWRHTLTKS